MCRFSDGVVVLALPVLALDENEMVYCPLRSFQRSCNFAMNHFPELVEIILFKLKSQAVATVLDESSVTGVNK